MKQNKLLERQLEQFFPEEFRGNEMLNNFIHAVNNSYNAYERDQELADRAFKISESEYIQITERLQNEITLKKRSINKLKEAIGEINEFPADNTGEELLGIATYLNMQINRWQKAEENLISTSLVASLNKNGIVFTDTSGIITWSNEGFFTLTGYDNDETTGKTPVELLKGPLTDALSLKKMIDLFLTGENFDVELICYKKDGSSFWGRTTGQSVADKNGKIYQYFAMLEDVTKEKEAQRRLQINEEKYRCIIANMNLGLLEVDEQDIIQYANLSFCIMSGFHLDELIGKEATPLFTKGDNSKILREKNQLRKENISDAYEIAVKNKRGEPKWWLISGAPRFNDSGKQVGSIGIHLDITEQKKLETELYRAREAAEHSAMAKEIFLANMSHEIRTPMNAIMGMSRQLTKTDLDKTQHFYLDTINKATGHLLTVINDILDISKIESGKMAFESIAFKLSDIIKHCMQVMQHKADEKGLLLIEHFSNEIAPVLIGDPHRLTQVLLNLVSNAVKFTEHGSVSICCDLQNTNCQRQSIYITVKDTGIGMEQDFMNNLFQAFVQEDKSIARKYGGTGLGMAISSQLIGLMNGHINVKSEKNKGTEVRLSLSFLIGSDKDLQDDNRDTENRDSLKGKRILLVEDNEMNRLVASTVLAEYGMLITEVQNGKEAVEEIQKNEYDLVLMDMQMPVMDGLQATAIIRGEGYQEIPIIALTANAITGESSKCFQAGMNDFVSKPFEEKQLLDTLQKWLNKNYKPDDTFSFTNKELPGNPALYDLSKIINLGRGDKHFMRKILSVFIKESTWAAEQIKTAAVEGNILTIKQISHRIKPSIKGLEIISALDDICYLESLDETKTYNGELTKRALRIEHIIRDVNEQLSLVLDQE